MSVRPSVCPYMSVSSFKKPFKTRGFGLNLEKMNFANTKFYFVSFCIFNTNIFVFNFVLYKFFFGISIESKNLNLNVLELLLSFI